MQSERSWRAYAYTGQPTIGAGVSPNPVIVLRGIAADAGRNWVYAPKGWRTKELEQWGDPGLAGDVRRLRRCMLTPTRVRQLIALYGQQPAVGAHPGRSLSDLLDCHTLVVDVMMVAR